MKAQIEFGLQGAFKVDLYSGSKLVESTDWFSNFITHTGLSYPSIYPFADCFRYLSIGSNNSVPNSGFGAFQTPTTGLATPINFFLTSSGLQKGQYIGWEGYEVGGQGQESVCGTLLTETGPRFYRAWSLPTGDISIVVTEPNGLSIGEFMVSPSSGGDTQGFLAFSRVQRNLVIPYGFRAIVSYQLKVNIAASGRQSLIPGQFNTGNADVSSDAALMTGWSQLSGYYRQVYHGLYCVDQLGNSFIPTYGAIMEPCLQDLNRCSFYLSPDNAAFEANPLLGGAQASETLAYQSDGLMAAIQGINLSWPGPSDFATFTHDEKQTFYFTAFNDPSKYQNWPPTITTPQNTRLGNNTFALQTPNLSNYSIDNTANLNNFNYQEFEDSSQQEISYATPGIIGLDFTKVIYGQKAVFSTRVFKLPVYNPTGRMKTQTRKTLFAPVSSLGFNTRFGSLTCAYRTDDTTDYPGKVFYPMIDCLFYDSHGRSMMQHYRQIAINLIERGTGIGDAYINILPTGNNINRLVSRRTIQGNISNGVFDWIGQGSPVLDSGIMLSGIVKDYSGNFSYTSSIGNSGWGAVEGVSGNTEYQLHPFDVGLTDHTLNNPLIKPTNISPIYWPSVMDGQQLTVSITGVKYYVDNNFNTCFNFSTSGNIPLSSGNLVAAGYNWTANPCNFCPPVAQLTHYENIGSTGFRLLPNFGLPNNNGNDTYSIQTGGYYPGLSFDNGLELFLDIKWSSPCGNAVDCIDP